MTRWCAALGVLWSLTACAHSKPTFLVGPLVVHGQQRPAMCHQAERLHDKNRHLKAVALYERGARCRRPHKYVESLVAVGQGEQAAALRLSELLTPQTPPISSQREAALWLGIGRDYRSIGELAQAWEAAQMGLSSAPEMPALRVLLAEIALDLGDLPTAEANLASVPSRGYRYKVAQARLLNAQGCPELAWSTLDSVSEKHRNRPPVQVLRTQLLLQSGALSQAEEEMKGRLYSVRSSNHTLLLSRRVAYLMALGERQQAKESWHLLQSMAPGSPLFPMAVPVQRAAKPWPSP